MRGKMGKKSKVVHYGDKKLGERIVKTNRKKRSERCKHQLSETEKKKKIKKKEMKT